MRARSAARRRRGGGAPLHLGKWQRGPRRFKFLALAREDAVENVGHQARACFFVKAMKSSSFWRASPLAITLRARSMPFSIDLATPAT